MFAMPYLPLKPGDTILSTKDIVNDGSFPNVEENALLVQSGTRGVVIEQGHLEDNEAKIVYLVKFEDINNPAELGPPIGCWPEDITMIPDA